MTDDDSAKLSERCKKLQYEMLDWSNKPRASKKSRRYKSEGKIYFIQFDGMVKIGFSLNVRTRIKNIQSGFPRPIDLLGTMDGTPLDELKLHRKFAKLRRSGEWFVATPDLLDYISASIKPFTKNSNRDSEQPERRQVISNG